MLNRITILDVIERFSEYRKLHNTWGSLHTVVEEGNVSDSNLKSCLEWSEKKGDKEGAELVKILLKMSKTQRGKIDKAVDLFLKRREDLYIINLFRV